MGGSGVDKAPPSAFLHAWKSGANGVEGGGQIDGDDLIPLLNGEFINGSDELHARVVDENVDGAEPLFSVLNKSLALFCLG